jgi:hypothetical protein
MTVAVLFAGKVATAALGGSSLTQSAVEVFFEVGQDILESITSTVSSRS